MILEWQAQARSGEPRTGEAAHGELGCGQARQATVWRGMARFG